MKRFGQELGWVAVAAAVFLLFGFTGCVATLETAPSARPDDDHPSVERTTNEAVMVSEAPAETPTAEGTAPDAALAAYTASAVEASAPAPERSLVDDEPLEATLRVHEIGLSENGGNQEITLHLSRSPDEVRHFPLDEPSRLVVDLEGPMSGSARQFAYEIGSDDVHRVRVGEHAEKLRVVADLTGDASAGYSVEQQGRSVVVTMPVAGVARDNETVYLAPGVLPAALRPTQVAAAEPESPVVAADDEVGRDESEADIEAGTAGHDTIDDTVDGAEAPIAAEDAEIVAEEPVALGDPMESQPEPEPAALSDEPETQLAGADEPEPEIRVAAIQEIPADDEALSPIDHVYEISDEAIEESVKEATAPAAADPVPAEPIDTVAYEPPAEPVDVAAYEPLAAPVAEEPTYALPMQAEDTGYTGQRISLDFKDADIQNVLRILADVSDLNIITTEDVAGRLTIRLVNVPWDQALDSILKAQGLDMVRDGNIVRISTVEKLKEERDALRAADEAQKQAEPLRVRYVRVNYAKADEALVKKVQEVLTERGTATWDERTNTIVVRDIARGVASAEELITEFDTQTPQVLIEANIVEATDSFARDLGVQWGYTYRSGPEIGNSTGQNFPGRVGAGGILAGGENSPATAVPFIADFPANIQQGAGGAYDLLLGSLDGAHSLNARLTALERQGKGKVISRPRVVTLNNVPAKIESLEILRVRLPSTGTVISTGAGGAAGAAQNATEQIRTGISLEVTPQVSSDGYIFLDVYAKSSALQDPTQSRAPSPDGIPNEVSREAESHVLIKDGETFVLGGVFRNVLDSNDTGLPFLSQIPVIGWAFKNKFDVDNRQELLVFVTPRAVRARGTENLASLPSAESLWHNRENP